MLHCHTSHCTSLYWLHNKAGTMFRVQEKKPIKVDIMCKLKDKESRRVSSSVRFIFGTHGRHGGARKSCRRALVTRVTTSDLLPW